MITLLYGRRLRLLPPVARCLLLGVRVVAPLAVWGSYRVHKLECFVGHDGVRLGCELHIALRYDQLRDTVVIVSIFLAELGACYTPGVFRNCREKNCVIRHQEGLNWQFEPCIERARWRISWMAS